MYILISLLIKTSDFNVYQLAAEVRAGKFLLCFCIRGGCYMCNSVEKLNKSLEYVS